MIENFFRRRSGPRRDGPVRVGIWSLDNGWRKNLISQFLSFAGDRRVEIHHTCTDLVLTSPRYIRRSKRARERGPLSHAQMLSWQARMDVNLCITLSEGSPMLPLESISAGVPVLVGQTTTFFDDDPFLRQRLAVSSPDDMGCIRTAVDSLLADYDAVTESIIRLGLKREMLFAQTRRRLKWIA